MRKDREGEKDSGHGAGGVILYVKNCIKTIIREDLKFKNFKESLCCDIYLDKFKLLVDVCYRPPNSKDDTDLYEAIKKTSRVPALIMGDFNYHIEWNSLL